MFRIKVKVFKCNVSGFKVKDKVEVVDVFKSKAKTKVNLTFTWWCTSISYFFPDRCLVILLAADILQ